MGCVLLSREGLRGRLPDFTAHTCSAFAAALCLSLRITGFFTQRWLHLHGRFAFSLHLEGCARKGDGSDCCLQIEPQICSGEAVG